MLNEFISVAEGFQTSVNIAYDLYGDEKAKSFIPTISAIDIIEDVMLSTASTSARRARIMIGAYGRGKSHIILVLLSLLFKKDRAQFETLLTKMKEVNPGLYDFVLEYLKSDKKILPVVISGSSASLTQSFLNALQQALHSAKLDSLMPETHFKAAITSIENWRTNYPDTYKRLLSELTEPLDTFILRLQEYDVTAYERFTELYPALTSGSVFNPFLGFDVVELYEKVTNELCANGYNGTFIIYDEFSKYLESSIANATISDIKLLQDFAEKCDRSGNKQMHLMLICHKDIANYIDEKLPKEKVDGWRGVSGRFKHMNLHNNYSQMYEIISAVITKDPQVWPAFYQEHRDKFDDLIKRFTANSLLSTTNGEAVNAAIEGCYPLHPISTFILPRLSEKVAQNERTLFTFLSASDKNTLSAFLNSAEGDFPMLTPDLIYDYFEPLLRKEPYTSDTHKLYKLTSSVLRKVAPDSLGAKIIKTISLIYIIEQFEKLPPVYDIIIEAFYDTTYSTQSISDALNGLIEKDCIVYLKRSNNYLKLKESSGVDIPGEIEKEVEKLKISETVTGILNRSVSDSYMYPTRYNDEHEITRYFDFTYISTHDFAKTTDWEERLHQSEADGVVFAVVSKKEDELEEIRKIIAERNLNNERIVFAVPLKFKAIEKIAYEYAAVIRLKSLVSDDEQLSDEYEIYIEDLNEVLGSFYLAYSRPENAAVDYYYGGVRRKLYRKAQLSSLLSQICEDVFPHTPVINNEAINKNHLPTVAINSRNKILTGLLANHLEPNLGMTGTGQEVSMMRSTLIQTGVLTNQDTHMLLELRPADENMAHVLGIIEDFFVEAKVGSGLSFAVLYEQLTSPEHGVGLKSGVIPIYVATVLHLYKKNLVIKYGDTETKITADLLNSINENPQAYTVIMEDWNEDKARYMSALSELFAEYIVNSERNYNAFAYLVSAMSRWYMALPKYTKDSVDIYLGGEKFESLPKTTKKFISSLRQQSDNPREYLFKKLFSIFEYPYFDLAIIADFADTKRRLDSMLPNLIAIIGADVKALFGGKKKRESTSSVVRDWYEDLKPETTQHLFARGENKILELFKTASSDDTLFIQRLCKAISGLRVDDWASKTIRSFTLDLVAFKETIEAFDSEEQQPGLSTEGTYRLVFSDSNGNESVKTFFKAEYGPKAKLLLNEITTALDEMGQSITEQEKRQVLLEALEKLC